MYVARKSFRNYGQMVLPGSVVEPDSIKWFKSRLKDKAIIEVNAHNFKQWSAYFKAKFGVDLPDGTKVAETKAEEVKIEAEPIVKKEAPAKKKVVTVVV